jgi:hypothetical protein
VIWGPIHLTEAPREEGRSANTQSIFSRWRASLSNPKQNNELRRFSEISDRLRQVRIVCGGRQKPGLQLSICFDWFICVAFRRQCMTR